MQVINKSIRQFKPASIIIPICDSIFKIHFNIVTCISIARQQFGKHFPARINAHKNRTSIASNESVNTLP
jgi:hypothetical protein